MRTGVIAGTIICELDKEYFAPWEELPLEQRIAVLIGDFSWFCLQGDFLHDGELKDSYEKEEL